MISNILARSFQDTFDLYTITVSSRGENEWSVKQLNLKGRVNESQKRIVNDNYEERGEGITYDLLIHTNPEPKINKGNGIKYNGKYYQVSNVFSSKSVYNKPVLQFLECKLTDDKPES